MSKYDTALVKKHLQMKINKELSLITSPKCLYIEEQYLTKLNFIFDFKFAEIMTGKIWAFQNDTEAIDVDGASTLIFVVSASVIAMRTIASMILHN